MGKHATEPPKPSATLGASAGSPSAGWRPSRDRERLSPVIWVAGFALSAAVIALMAALFGVG